MYDATQPPSQYATGVPAHHMTAPSEWSTAFVIAPKIPLVASCLTCWCPCITFGRIAEVVDKGNTSCGVSVALYSILCLFTGCQCIYSCMYRSKLRQQYVLSEQPCNDCLVHCCCDLCAMCQEYRELKYRGFEPELGWQGNLARQNQGVAMPPAGPGEMKR